MIDVPLASITADPNQPRKNFNPERLAELMSSIKKYGIINPLIVEELTAGKYLLEDGERRFRAATELKLKMVPVVVREAVDETERLIRQFHIQEQHEGWSATEKAHAVSILSERLGVGVRVLAETLSLPERTIADYVSFSQLLEKKEFVKNEIPVHFAHSIVPLRAYVKRIFMSELDTEFTASQEKALERAVIARIKSGSIKIRRDITKIRDSVKSQPKSILKFISNESMTVDAMFLKTDAKAAFSYRNILAASHQIMTYTNSGGRLGVEKLFSDEDKKDLNRAKDSLNALISKI